MQVVPPVVAMTPTLVDMDTSGAGPESTMGPGMAVQSEEMPLVLDTDGRIKQWKDEEWRQRWAEDPFQHPTDSMDTEDLDDTTEK